MLKILQILIRCIPFGMVSLNQLLQVCLLTPTNLAIFTDERLLSFANFLSFSPFHFIFINYTFLFTKILSIILPPPTNGSTQNCDCFLYDKMIGTMCFEIRFFPPHITHFDHHFVLIQIINLLFSNHHNVSKPKIQFYFFLLGIQLVFFFLFSQVLQFSATILQH